MNTKNFGKMFVLTVGLICISAGYTQANNPQAEALSKEVKIQLNDVTIAEALEKIGKKAGVNFVLSDEAVWKLPHGEATRLSVALQGPLAGSMTEMLNAFFMRYAVGDEEITIYPRPELEHVLGRPTAKQLELLRAIYTNAIAEYRLSPQNSINEALGEYVALTPYDAQENIDEILHRMAGKELVVPRPENYRFDLTGPMTVANMLEQIRPYMFNGNMGWYLSGMEFLKQVPEIRVVSRDGFREAKLDQVVDISFKDETAETIIQRLATWTGMRLVIQKEDPSWLEEKMTVDMQNIKLRQVLINIVTTVDGSIGIDVQRNRISVRGPRNVEKVVTPKPRRSRSSRGAAGQLATSEGYVGKISIPMDGGAYFIEFMLRESDLTEELKNLRAEKVKEILAKHQKSEPAKKSQN